MFARMSRERETKSVASPSLVIWQQFEKKKEKKKENVFLMNRDKEQKKILLSNEMPDNCKRKCRTELPVIITV